MSIMKKQLNRAMEALQNASNLVLSFAIECASNLNPQSFNKPEYAYSPVRHQWSSGRGNTQKHY